MRPGSRPPGRGVEIEVSQITLRLAAAESREAAPLRLEPGAQVVARLVSAPAAGGRGLISLAGHLLEARLPSGLQAGSTLPLEVVRADPAQVVVRIVPQAPGSDQAAAQAVPGTIWLPGGAAVQLSVDPDDGSPESRGDAAGEAAFVLHDPVLGAIEVRLRLAPGGVLATVRTPSGALADRAAEELPDLISRLGAATGRPAAATASVRPPGVPAPAPPQGAVDVQA